MNDFVIENSCQEQVKEALSLNAKMVGLGAGVSAPLGVYGGYQMAKDKRRAQEADLEYKAQDFASIGKYHKMKGIDRNPRYSKQASGALLTGGAIAGLALGAGGGTALARARGHKKIGPAERGRYLGHYYDRGYDDKGTESWGIRRPRQIKEVWQ